MAYLKYDVEKMECTKKKYTECVSGMEELQAEMATVVDTVRKAWKSEAGDAFFDKYDNEWLKGFTQYKDVLQHMADNLGVAKEDYDEITKQANKLKIR